MNKVNAFFCKYYIGLLFLVLFIPLLWISPDIWEDSAQYLNFSNLKAPLYPMFLWLFKGFGSLQLEMALIIQVCITFLFYVYTVNWLRENLNFTILLALIICMVLNFGLYSPHYTWVRSILSEPIAFPLFGLSIFFLVDYLKTVEVKKAIQFSITINLLILCRNQFYFMYFMLFLLFFWQLFKENLTRKVLISIGVFILISLLSCMLGKVYNYVNTGMFAGNPDVGAQAIIQPLYLASKEDSKIFKDSIEKKVFDDSLKQLEAQHFTSASAVQILRPPLGVKLNVEYFSKIYIREIRVILDNLPAEYNQSENTYKRSDLLLSMAKKLFMHNLNQNIKFYVGKVSAFIGSVPFATAILIFFIAILPFLMKTQIRGLDKSQIFCVVSLLFVLGNASFVAIFQIGEERFLYYGCFLYYCISGLLAMKFQKNIISDSQQLSGG